MGLHFPRTCDTPEKRSAFASKLAQIRWDDFHSGLELRPPQMPELVRRITIEDFVGGTKHVFDLNRCGRIDQYRVEVDGRPWRDAVGLAGILSGIRKAWGRYSRVSA